MTVLVNVEKGNTDLFRKDTCVLLEDKNLDFSVFLGRFSRHFLGRFSKHFLGRFSKHFLGRFSKHFLGRFSKHFLGRFSKHCNRK